MIKGVIVMLKLLKDSSDILEYVRNIKSSPVLGQLRPKKIGGQTYVWQEAMGVFRLTNEVSNLLLVIYN